MQSGRDCRLDVSGRSAIHASSVLPSLPLVSSITDSVLLSVPVPNYGTICVCWSYKDDNAETY